MYLRRAFPFLWKSTTDTKTYERTNLSSCLGIRKLTKFSLFLGRERELAQMEELFSKVQKGQGQICSITGEMGVGKTTLVNEFIVEEIPKNCFAVVETFCSYKISSNVAYGFLIRIFHVLIEQNRVFPGVLEALKNTPLYNDIASCIKPDSKLYNKFPQIPPVKYIPEEAIFHRVFKALEMVATKSSLVLFLDNFQWCDNFSRKFISFLANKINTIPVFLILGYRGPENSLNNLNGANNIKNIHVAKFSHRSTRLYLQQRFPKRRFEEDFIRKFIRVTKGIPLFWQEASNALWKNLTWFSKTIELDWDSSKTEDTTQKKQAIFKPYILPYMADKFLVEKDHAKASFLYFLAATKEKKKQAIDETIYYCKKSLEASKEIEADLQINYQKIKTFILQGICFCSKEYYSEAKKTLIKAQQLAEQSGIIKNIPEILYRLSHIEINLKNKNKAMELLNQGITHCGTKNREWKVFLLKQQAQIHLQDYRFGTAKELLNEAIENDVKQKFTAVLYCDIAQIQLLSGNFLAAIELYERSAELFEKEQKWHKQSMVLRKAGQILQGLGHWKISLNKYQKALKMAENSGDVLEKIEVETFLIGFYLQKGEFSKAKPLILEVQSKCDYVHYIDGTVRCLKFLGYIAKEEGHFSKALDCYNEAIELCHKNNLVLTKADILEKFSLVYKKWKLWKEAEELLHEALDIWETSKAPLRKGICLYHIGNILFASGNIEASQSYFYKSLEYIDLHAPNSGKQALVLESLSKIYLRGGRWRKAEITLQKSFDTCKDTNTKELTSFLVMGDLHRCQKNYKEAIGFYEKALDISKESDYKKAKIMILTKKAKVYEEQELFQKSSEALCQVKKINQKQNEIELANVYRSFASLYQKYREFSKVQYLLEKALRIYQKYNCRYEQAQTLNHLGNFWGILQQAEESYDCFYKALEIREDINDDFGKAKTLHCIGEMHLQEKKTLLAMEHFSESFVLKEKVADTLGQAYTYKSIGKTYLQLNRWDKAIENFEQALFIFEKFSETTYVAELAYRLGELYRKEGNGRKARRYFQQAYRYYKRTNRKLAIRINSKIEELE